MALVLSLLALTFALQNTDSVTLHFLLWDFPPMKVGFAVGVPFIIGVFVGLLLSWRQHKKTQKMHQAPEPGTPAALLANAPAAAAGGKKKASWWW
jgi:uncharacterized integral membrane protein